MNGYYPALSHMLERFYCTFHLSFSRHICGFRPPALCGCCPKKKANKIYNTNGGDQRRKQKRSHIVKSRAVCENWFWLILNDDLKGYLLTFMIFGGGGFIFGKWGNRGVNFIFNWIIRREYYRHQCNLIFNLTYASRHWLFSDSVWLQFTLNIFQRSQLPETDFVTRGALILACKVISCVHHCNNEELYAAIM